MSKVQAGGLATVALIATTNFAAAACGFEDRDSHSLFDRVVGTGYNHINQCYDAGIRAGGRDNGQFVVDNEGNRLLFVCGSQQTPVRSRNSGLQNTRC